MDLPSIYRKYSPRLDRTRKRSNQSGRVFTRKSSYASKSCETHAVRFFVPGAQPPRVFRCWKSLCFRNSNSHGARPVHLIITMIKCIRTSRLAIKNSLSGAEDASGGGERSGAVPRAMAHLGECALCHRPPNLSGM